jgi:hypothetical protein
MSDDAEHIAVLTARIDDLSGNAQLIARGTMIMSHRNEILMHSYGF